MKTTTKLITLVTLLTLTFSPWGVTLAHAAEIRYVAPTGTGDCSSWAAACALQTALTGAVSGDEIWVAAGTYLPSTGDRTATFQLKNGVAIYGGFLGTETARDQRNPALNVTILSGDLLSNDAGFTNNDENSYHVVTGATDATLDGFTITAGNANGADPHSSGGGGGMFNSGSSPTLTNLTFRGNSATNGGGMYNISSSLALTNTTFSGNAATNGGGMRNDYSSLTLTNVTFSSNSATNLGGGLCNAYSSPTLTNVTINGNTAYGMVDAYASNPVIRNSIFWGNGGGSILYEGTNTGVATVTDSVVEGGFPGTNIITADPRLGEPGNYGGFTQTIPLLPGSSAINATTANCPATDQRGLPRSLPCDLGAYEFKQVITNAATAITTTGATLNGTVNADGSPTTVAFEYGLTTSYGFVINADQSSVTGSVDTAVTAALTGLLPNIPYHFRVVAGTINGLDQTFTTLALVERAKNGSFETYVKTSLVPANWKAVKFGPLDGKNTLAKKIGKASVKIVGAGTATKTLTQTLTLSGVAGDAFTLSYWVKGSRLPRTGICQAQVLLYNGTTLSGSQTLKCPTAATFNWKKMTLNFNAPAAYTKVVIKITFKKASGTIWFDGLSLMK